MHHDESQSAAHGVARVPVPITHDAAEVGGVHLNGFGCGGEFEPGARKVVPDNRLDVAISQSTARREGR
jgi:hypothetical protein